MKFIELNDSNIVNADSIIRIRKNIIEFGHRDTTYEMEIFLKDGNKIPLYYSSSDELIKAYNILKDKVMVEG